MRFVNYCIPFLFRICTVSQLFWNRVCITINRGHGSPYLGIMYYFLFFFSHITQHSIQNITKQQTHIQHLKVQSKGRREGRTIKTQKPLRCTFTSHYLQEATDPTCFSTHVWCKPVYSKQHSFCTELIQRPESSLRRHKLGVTDQSIRSNDDITCVHKLMMTGHSQNICRKVPDDVVLHIWQFKFDCSFILNIL